MSGIGNANHFAERLSQADGGSERRSSTSLRHERSSASEEEEAGNHSTTRTRNTGVGGFSILSREEIMDCVWRWEEKQRRKRAKERKKIEMDFMIREMEAAELAREMEANEARARHFGGGGFEGGKLLPRNLGLKRISLCQ